MKLVVNIEKRLRSFTLAANFTLTDTTLALLGASGSGKSMTLKCIAGLERPDRGQILLNGRTLYDSEKGINLPPQARGGKRSASSPRTSRASLWKESKMPILPASRAASSSVLPLRASSRAEQTSCSSTSRFPHSTPT